MHGKIFTRGATFAIVALVGLGIAGTATASADPAAPAGRSSSVSTPTVTDSELSNLDWVWVGELGGGGKVLMLRMVQAPETAGSGVFFLYDPAARSMGAGFRHGDIVTPTVDSWDQVQFSNDPSVQELQVRFGDVNAPDDAAVVASITNF